LSNYILEEGDIVVGRRGEIGRCAVVGPDEHGWVCGTGSFFVRPLPSLNSRFLAHLIRSDDYREKLEQASTGATMKNLSNTALGELVIGVPPLPEQQRIVGLLDESFAGLATAKANAEKNLRNARALFESHRQSVLRSKKWKWKTLGELCDDVEYGSSAKSKTEGEVPVLRMGNIQNGRLDWENLAYTDDKAEIKKYLLKHNDVLFNRTNSPELVGKTAIYRGEMPAIFAGYLIRIHRKEELLDADFLSYFLNSQIAFDYGKTVVISSVNQANINGTKLKGYPIPAPSLSEQKQIVAKLDSLSEETQHLATVYERKLDALEALKKSLLHQAFTGEL
jgi:type I restriction enzyme S subunit